MTRLLWLPVIVLWMAATGLRGQQSDVDEVARASEFVIPSVPAFVLLDANPAQVTRPGFSKDFTLDLLVKDDGFAPDIALEVHPVWVFFFEDVSHSEYVGMDSFKRKLSTLSVSGGTVEDEEGRRFGWSAKLSLVGPDPLLDSAYNADMDRVLDISDAELRLFQELDDGLEAATTEEERTRVLARYAARIARLEEDATKAALRVVEDYRERVWNATALDVAVGQVYAYEGEALEELEFEASGFGGWVAAGTGFGTEQFLLSGLGKVVDLGDETDWSLGANLRLGGARANAFVEFVYMSPGDDEVDVRNIAYGGEFRFDESKKLEFGLRTGYDSDFDLRRLLPVVKLDWTIGGVDLSDVLR